jgi:hypothetical protein
VTDLLLVTCSEWPDGEPGAAVLDAALTERGVTSRWVCWDDPDVDWSGPLVATRSTWDYDARRGEFMAWAASVPRLLNGVEVFAWNTDKAYLVELAAAGLPVVPTFVLDGPAVVKPRVGAGGRGVVVLDQDALGGGHVVVQPLVESVRTEGEASVFVLGGEPVSMVRKLPSGDEIRVHEHYGGTTVAVVPTEEATRLARHTVGTAERIIGRRLDYGRVDLMRLADGTLAVSELEVTEPGLYLEEVPANGPAFAALVAGLLAG